MMEYDVRKPGFWPSALSPALVAEGGLRFGRVQVADGAVYWSESRPSEQGRSAIMRWTPDEGVAELLPAPYSARSRVHEYGGGEFLVAGGALFFVNDGDQDIYAVPLAEAHKRPRRVTAIGNTRFADLAFDRRLNRLLAVAEVHPRRENSLRVQNSLCAIPLSGNEPVTAVVTLDDRFDFYASPRLNPSCDAVAYLSWKLPSMPWDSAALYRASINADGSLDQDSDAAAVFREGARFACFQPEWSEDGDLFCVSDARGFGDLYRVGADGQPPVRLTDQCDLGRSLWSFNASSYALCADRRVYYRGVADGEEKTYIFDQVSGSTANAPSPLTATTGVSAGNGLVAFVGLTDGEPLFVGAQSLMNETSESDRLPEFQILRRSSAVAIDRDLIPAPTRVAFPNADGGTTYGLLYAPANPELTADASKAPLIVNLHGGPTSQAVRGLKLRTAFFTSRGFSWLDLDYAGSTGYGRAYRQRLEGRWGIADVADTLAAAQYVSEAGLADKAGLFVTGGSAGGYTVMMTIAASNVFRGATSYYGICDLAQLQRTTHKFEHGYLETLLGASLEADPALYAARSPLTHANRIQTPLLLFQGADDKVVPRDQALMIAKAIKKNGATVDYHEFDGEGHGFRRAETISRTLDLELAFYQRLLSSAHEKDR